MNIYRFLSQPTLYQSLVIVDDCSSRLIRNMAGESLTDIYNPVRASIMRGDESGTPKPSSDFPYLAGHVPVFSQRARDTLASMLDRFGESLELECEADLYWLYNVTNLIDVLDEVNSDVLYFHDLDSSVLVQRYEFFAARLEGQDIFKIIQEPLSHVFVSQYFVDRVEKAGLRGCRFELVWSADGKSYSRAG